MVVGPLQGGVVVGPLQGECSGPPTEKIFFSIFDFFHLKNGEKHLLPLYGGFEKKIETKNFLRRPL